jgi:hypothetical protein
MRQRMVQRPQRPETVADGPRAVIAFSPNPATLSMSFRNKTLARMLRLAKMRFHAGFSPAAARPDACPIPPDRAGTGPSSAP